MAGFCGVEVGLIIIISPCPMKVFFINTEYCTRRFIGEELILAIGDFSENSPILNPPIINNYVDTPIKP